MTQEEKAKAYDEVLKTATQWIVDGCSDKEKICLESIFPQLRESEDERIMEEIISALKFANDGGVYDKHISYLEKQKESLHISESCDSVIEVRSFQRGVEEGRKLEKQKESHYTKRNELFDKCVENCDPKTVEEVNKRVDDIMNMPELSAFEQALTNLIGYWEDDEERWPSKFVKKHSKHILDMAREELQKEQKVDIDKLRRDIYQSGYNDGYQHGKEDVQKEQKSVEYFSKDKVYAIMNKLTELSTSNLIPINSPEYLKIHQITKDVRSLLDYPIEQEPESCEPDTNVEKVIEDVIRVYGKTQGEWVGGYDVDTLIVNLRRAFNKKEQKPVVTHGETYHVDTLGTQQVIAGKMPQKPAEWSEEDEIYLQDALWCVEKAEKSCKDEEDKGACWSAKRWLKSRKPSWKPSEDEERLIKTSICFLKDFADTGYENAVECIDWLKSKLNGNTCK